MKKRLLSLILLFFLIFHLSLAPYAEIDLDVNAKSALLMDGNTGRVIYGLNENEKLPPASITKVMTLLLGLEAISEGRISLADELVISEEASSIKGSTVFLEAGEKQVVEELFKAIAIRSANDASVALAEHISGSEEAFVKKMNERARELGMSNTNFVNSSGWPSPNHYTTAYDIAIMSRELLKHDKAQDWLTTYMVDMTVGKKKKSIQTMVNTNELIKKYDGANGVKTGSTNEAGFCLSASAKRGDLQLIAVILGVNNSKLRFDEAKRMLDYGFANFETLIIGKKNQVFASLPTEKGKLREVELVLDKDSYLLLAKENKADVKKELILPDLVPAPIKKGDKIGEMIVTMAGKEIDRLDLVARVNVEKANYFNILERIFKSYIEGR